MRWLPGGTAWRAGREGAEPAGGALGPARAAPPADDAVLVAEALASMGAGPDPWADDADADEMPELELASLGASAGEQDVLSLMVGALSRLLEGARQEGDRKLLAQLLRALHAGDLDLPRLPAVTRELMALRPDTDLDAARIARLVARDQDVTAAVLKVANSPVYGNGNVRSLDRAVTMLGLDTFRHIAMGVAASGGIFDVPGYKGSVIRERQHAFRTAMLAWRLAVEVGERDLAGGVFLGGLLHDVGKIVAFRNLSAARRAARGAAASRPVVDALLRRLHAPLGLYYALQRDLPRQVRDEITFHHRPDLAPRSSVLAVALVAAAELVDEDPRGVLYARERRELAERVRLPRGADGFGGLVERAGQLAAVGGVMAG